MTWNSSLEPKISQHPIGVLCDPQRGIGFDMPEGDWRHSDEPSQLLLGYAPCRPDPAYRLSDRIWLRPRVEAQPTDNGPPIGQSRPGKARFPCAIGTWPYAELSRRLSRMNAQVEAPFEQMILQGIEG
jgi:hypothetical protein